MNQKVAITATNRVFMAVLAGFVGIMGGCDPGGSPGDEGATTDPTTTAEGPDETGGGASDTAPGDAGSDDAVADGSDSGAPPEVGVPGCQPTLECASVCQDQTCVDACTAQATPTGAELFTAFAIRHSPGADLILSGEADRMDRAVV
jgi:hypothetical protein